MAHEVSAEELSSFLDGELPAERRTQVAEHLRTCAACARQLAGFQKVGAAFREHGQEPLPAGLADRILRRLRPQRRELRSALELGLALAAAVGVVLVAGMALKRVMPGLFTQVQQMISGAAGTLGK